MLRRKIIINFNAPIVKIEDKGTTNAAELKEQLGKIMEDIVTSGVCRAFVPAADNPSFEELKRRLRDGAVSTAWKGATKALEDAQLRTTADHRSSGLKKS